MTDGSDAVFALAWAILLDFFAAGASFEVVALRLRLFPCCVVDEWCEHVCCMVRGYETFLHRLRK